MMTLQQKVNSGQGESAKARFREKGFPKEQNRLFKLLRLHAAEVGTAGPAFLRVVTALSIPKKRSSQAGIRGACGAGSGSGASLCYRSNLEQIPSSGLSAFHFPLCCYSTVTVLARFRGWSMDGHRS